MSQVVASGNFYQPSKKLIGCWMSGFQSGRGVMPLLCTQQSRNPSMTLPRNDAERLPVGPLQRLQRRGIIRVRHISTTMLQSVLGTSLWSWGDAPGTGTG